MHANMEDTGIRGVNIEDAYSAQKSQLVIPCMGRPIWRVPLGGNIDDHGEANMKRDKFGERPI